MFNKLVIFPVFVFLFSFSIISIADIPSLPNENVGECVSLMSHSKEIIVVVAYTPGCEYWQQFKPTFEQAMQLLQEKYSNISYYKFSMMSIIPNEKAPGELPGLSTQCLGITRIAVSPEVMVFINEQFQQKPYNLGYQTFYSAPLFDGDTDLTTVVKYFEKLEMSLPSIKQRIKQAATAS